MSRSLSRTGVGLAGVPYRCVLLLCLSIPAWPASAVTCTWTAAGGGDWTNTANWDTGAPGPSDEALFDSGSAAVTVTVAVTVNKLTVTNCTRTITFAQGVPADITVSNDLYLGTGSVIRCPYASTSGNGTGRVITVFGNAVIKGTINADEYGFVDQTGPGYGGNCGSHGGLGSGGATYGSLTQPTALGSGATDNQKGGGAIKLEVAGALTVDGTISACGGGSGWPPSGGSIWLIADTFAGSGIIRANAGGNSPNGGGGGGRIAVEYTNSTFSGWISVAGSRGGQAGTLWEPKRFVGLEGSIGSPQAMTITNSYQYYAPDTNSTYYWNLTVNGAWFELHSNALVVADLLLTNGATVRFDKGMGGTDTFDLRALAITNSITLANASTLALPQKGAYALGGDLYVETNATVYVFGNTTVTNEDSGGTGANPHGIGVTLNCRNATIKGTINADWWGFTYHGPGWNANVSGHGGRGMSSGTYGPAYGQLTRPTALGSASTDGQRGGGAVKLNASGTLLLEGVVTADARPGSAWAASGGSVWLLANSLAGGGSISVDAVNNANTGGGGGRACIEYGGSTFTGSVTAARGIGGWANCTGEWGTVCSLQLPVSGAIASSYSVTSNSNGVRIVRTRVPAGSGNLRWIESCTDLANSNQLNNTVTYNLSGLTPATRYSIFTNDTLMVVTNSDVSGGISNIVVGLSGGPVTVFIEEPPHRTVFVVH